MMVSLLIMSLVLVATLEVFDFSSKLARAQTNISDMQQSLRAAQYDMVRLIRMAGRGPLPLRTGGRSVPTGVAVEVFNNAPAGTQVGFTAGAGPRVLAGTDILTIRGVFNSSLYQVNYGDPATFTTTGTGGTVRIAAKSPTGVPHDLAPLLDVVCDTADVPEAVLLVSPLDDAIFAVVELDAAGSRSSVDCSAAPATIETVDLEFRTSGGTHVAAYSSLSAGGVFPTALTSVAFVGLLEEYRFYIREFYVDSIVAPGDTGGTELQPRFSKARVFPGTDVPYKSDDANWRGDIADAVFDLQVALGIDGNGDGAITDAGDTTDEWLFNAVGDNPGDAKWNTVQPPGPTPVESRLYNLRLSTVARTGRRDPGYQAPVLTTIEDHSYAAAPSNRFNERWERAFRRRALQTIVDMRNVS
jgi:hypothetical protein